MTIGESRTFEVNGQSWEAHVVSGRSHPASLGPGANISLPMVKETVTLRCVSDVEVKERLTSIRANSLTKMESEDLQRLIEESKEIVS